MSRPNQPKMTIGQLYGEDADLKAETGYPVPPFKVLKNLHRIPLQPDPDYPNHRDHLSHFQRDFIQALLYGRFSFKRNCGVLRQIADEYGFCYRQARRCVRFLERQGLLEVVRTPGQAHRFSLAPLFEKIRQLLGMKRRAEAFAPEERPSEPEEAEPAREARPEPEPEPAAEPELQLGAPEWDQALPLIEREIDPKDYLLYFARTRAYWSHGRLTVRARDKEQWTMLQTRYRRVINRNTGHDVVILGPPRSSA